MAGWNEYIKNIKDSHPCITKVAIIGVPDGSVWAKTMPPSYDDFRLTPDETAKMGAMWAKLTDLPCSGLHAEGSKYIVPMVDEQGGFVLGKKAASEAGDQGKYGLVVVKTNTACIVAQFEGDRENGIAARTVVEKMAQYLQGVGY